MDFYEKISSVLPENIREKCLEHGECEEIRLRKNGRLAFFKKGKLEYSDHVVTAGEINETVCCFTKNSYHTYLPYILKGFIPYEGARIGVCGKAVYEKDKLTALSEITSLNIRIPSSEDVIPDELVKRFPTNGSVLVFSPPGGGKTTLLKKLWKRLASPPYGKKVCVIDTRGELADGPETGNADVLSFYPRGEALEKAIRTLSPQTAVFDEIGADEDESLLIDCKRCGIELLCSVHSDSAGSLLKKPKTKRLYLNGVFDYYIGITEKDGIRKYDVYKKEDLC